MTSNDRTAPSWLNSIVSSTVVALTARRPHSKQRGRFAVAVAKSAVPKVNNDHDAAAANKAVDRLHAAFPKWRNTDPVERANIMVRAAAIMRSRRDELSGLVIRESGKPWREADADVCETIDFCEYSARQPVSLFKPERLGSFARSRLDGGWSSSS